MLGNALDLGPHAAFIWSAYAVTAICLIGLTIAVIAADRRQHRLLADLETRGITRRSAAKSTRAKAGPHADPAEAEPKKQTIPRKQTKPRSGAKSGPSRPGGATKTSRRHSTRTSPGSSK